MLRPNGIHHGETRAEVIAQFERCKWAGRALDMHLFRVTTGGAQAAWIRFVYSHTFGSNNPQERRAHKEFSPVVHPEDAAKEFGLSVQMMRHARNECVARGFTPRKSRIRADGKDYYRYGLDMEALAKAPNAWDAQREASAREDAFVKRKPALSAGVDRAKDVVLSMTSEELRESPIAPDEVVLVAVDQPELEVTHSLPCPVVMLQTVSDSGRPRIHLSSPATSVTGEARKSQPAEEGAKGASAGAGLQVVNSMTGKPLSVRGGIVGEIAAADSAAPAPNPDQQALPFSDDTLVTRLAELGMAPEDADVATIRRDLRCDVHYFLESAKDRVKRAKPGERISRRLLPYLVKSANETWRNGGQKAWEARAPGDDAPVVAVKQDPLLKRLREDIERRKSWPTS
jgi:hypothetical protein